MTMVRPLAVAVLTQAISDLEGPSHAARADARAWFEGRTRGDVSFELTCDLLGLDAGAVRDGLRARGLLSETHEDAA